MNKTVPAGGCVGIIGGGQLGRMLALAAARLGLDTCVLAPDAAETPAGRVAAQTLCAAYEDQAALEQFAKACDVVTYEFENIPAAALHSIEQAGALVYPSIYALETACDRLKEKQFLSDLGLQVAPFAPVQTRQDLQTALETIGAGFLKTRWSGYDGRGQIALAPGDDLAVIWEWLDDREAIYEAHIPFAFEASVLLVRDRTGQTKIYDIPKNTHENGILVRCEVPAPLSSMATQRAQDMAEKLAQALNHVGMLALEIFVTPEEDLLANEFAPRVHNSGHWTETVCVAGQFEQHIRAICGWPLGDTQRLADARMDNLLGHDADEAPFDAQAGSARALHLYGKRPVRAGRKMGHVTHVRTGHGSG